MIGKVPTGREARTCTRSPVVQSDKSFRTRIAAPIVEPCTAATGLPSVLANSITIRERRAGSAFAVATTVRAVVLPIASTSVQENGKGYGAGALVLALTYETLAQLTRQTPGPHVHAGGRIVPSVWKVGNVNGFERGQRPHVRLPRSRDVLAADHADRRHQREADGDCDSPSLPHADMPHVEGANGSASGSRRLLGAGRGILPRIAMDSRPDGFRASQLEIGSRNARQSTAGIRAIGTVGFTRRGRARAPTL